MKPLVVVVGDALLDIDVEGSSTRLCPDAPAPVVDVAREILRPGGAALAACLAAADGHEVVLVTPLAGDPDADRLVALLEPAVRVVGIPTDGTTPVKRRVRAGGQTLLRLDTGAAGQLDERLPDLAVRLLERAAVVLVSDYGRGVSAHAGLRSLLGGRGRPPVVWDPHPLGAAPVPGVRVVTPNAAEARSMAAALPEPPSLTGPPDALGGSGVCAEALVAGWAASSVVVTMGARGALLSDGLGPPVVVPAQAVGHGDTCGAGDRFAARVATVLAVGGSIEQAVTGATAAATAFVAAGGAAGFSLQSRDSGPPQDRAAAVVAQVRAAGGTVVATGGCFDLLHAGHVASLTAARGLGDCLVVCLNSDASVRRLKGSRRPVVPEADRVRMLKALSCVDAVVVFDEDSPAQVLDRLRPDLWAKGGDYAQSDLPEAAVLRQWGGQAVVLPYLDGRSTSALVSSITRTPPLREEAS